MNLERWIDWGVAARPLEGETLSGDAHALVVSDEAILAAVVDGAGHGPEAADVARLAIEVLERHAGDAVDALLRRCETALSGTRGAAVSLASFSPRDGTMTWAGVGNVEGAFLIRDAGHGARREVLLLRNGIVGIPHPPARVSTLPVRRGDTLVFATDGLRQNFLEGIDGTAPARNIARSTLRLYAKGTDDALCLVARWTA